MSLIPNVSILEKHLTNFCDLIDADEVVTLVQPCFTVTIVW